MQDLNAGVTIPFKKLTMDGVRLIHLHLVLLQHSRIRYSHALLREILCVFLFGQPAADCLPQLAQALIKVTSDPVIRDRAAEIGRQLATEDGVANGTRDHYPITCVLLRRCFSPSPRS